MPTLKNINPEAQTQRRQEARGRTGGRGAEGGVGRRKEAAKGS